MVSALNLIVGNHGGPTLLGFSGEWPQVFLTQQMLEGLPYLPGLELVLGSSPRVVFISLPNTAFPTYTESMSKLLR